MLTKNLTLLQKKFPQLPINTSMQLSSEVVIEPSKSVEPTMKVKYGENFTYLHSKYNPKKEAEILSVNLDLSKYEHIIFLGVGLGYHIDSILKKNPNLTYSLYEDNNTILYQFLNNTNLQELEPKNLLLVSSSNRQKYIQEQMSVLSEIHFPKTYIFILPSLKVNFASMELELLSNMKEKLKMKKTNMVTNFHFQKRWTTNVLHNFEDILLSPPIMSSRNLFSGQTAFLVAAGPSLKFEYDNLKQIKRDKLGYIFTVGSAINALISENILPDAAFTYDPTEKNQTVFKLLKDKKKSEIPLIFGSTVGYETLKGYPGEKFHFITSQDTVSSYYLSSIEPFEIIFDAPSIAVITYQILSKLGFSKIVLVGQNFAYLNDSRYSTGIEYENVSSKVSDKELQGAITIQDVSGEKILSTEGFVSMKTSLEHHIQLTKGQVEVINTTLHGAKIEGAEFTQLSEILPKLKIRDEVVFGRKLRELNEMTILNRQSNLKIHYTKLNKLLEKLSKISYQINSNYQNLSGEEMNKLYIKIDKTLTEIEKNKFYYHFVHPVIRTSRQVLEEGFKKLEYQNDPIIKAKIVVDILDQFLLHSKETTTEVFSLAEKKRGI